MLVDSQPSVALSGVPVYHARELAPRRTRYCVVVPSLNEGERLRDQLSRMHARADLADILIADGGSMDGSTEEPFLLSRGVRALLVTPESGLGAALRMGFHYALVQGYEGVVTVDGNGKDGVEALPEFLRLLDAGFDFIQGSRYMAGGRHEHTPLDRSLAIKLIASPLIWLGGGWYSDPTNGFKGLSRRFLLDPRVQPLRPVFQRFNLQIYLNCRAARLRFRVTETPVTRVYPADGSVPTKIVRFRTKLLILKELGMTVAGEYNPKSS